MSDVVLDQTARSHCDNGIPNIGECCAVKKYEGKGKKERLKYLTTKRANILNLMVDLKHGNFESIYLFKSMIRQYSINYIYIIQHKIRLH